MSPPLDVSACRNLLRSFLAEDLGVEEFIGLGHARLKFIKKGSVS